MAYDYTAIPDTSALTDLLTSVGLGSLASSVDADLLAQYLGEAQELIERKTRRQFVPGSAGEVRYYNGNGTGTLVIDEYIDVTAVEFILGPSPGTVNALDYIEVERNGDPKTLLQIRQGPAHFVRGYWNTFPRGRSNIKVTGQFGYAASIPKPIWGAMLRMAAQAVINANTISGGTRLAGWKDADVSEDYQTNVNLSEIAGWDTYIREAIKDYRKGAAQVIAQSRPTLL